MSISGTSTTPGVSAQTVGAPIAKRTPARLRLLPRRWATRRAVWIGAGILGLIVVLCLLVPVISPYASDEIAGQPLEAPSPGHLFGTDAVGRDVFVRTFAGGRIDLLAAAIAISFAMIVGTLVGTLAGSSRRRLIDTVLMRIVDAVMAFPFIILLLALIAVIGVDRRLGPLPAGLPATLMAFVMVQWAGYARLARGQALSLRDRDYVVAAGILGLSRARIIVRHIAPSVARITGAFAVGDAVLVIVVLASLPFLGAGVQPPTPEWGSIMYDGRGFLRQAWWITVMPGVVLAFTGLGLSLVADALLGNRRVEA